MKGTLVFLWHLATCLSAQASVLYDPLPPPEYNEAADNGSQGFYPRRTYVTAEGIRAPETNFLTWNQECDDGLKTFITPRGFSMPVPYPGPMILDERGELVWFHHFDNKFGGEAYNFLVQNYKGEDLLTFWLGDDRVRGHGAGFYYLMNSSYDIIHKVGAANGLSADLHEFLISPEGTALMTVYQIIPGPDLSWARTFDPENRAEDREPNWIWDGILQEVNIETGELIFEWRASEHVDVHETYRSIYMGGTKSDPWDWYHINSIQKDEFGNYLVSARYPHSVMYIDGKTKETIWQLGGRKNSFMDLSEGEALDFAWQHDARFRDADTFPNTYPPPPERPGYTTKLVTLFDNTAEDQHYHFGHPYSRGLMVELTYPTPGTERAKAGPAHDEEPRPELEGEHSEDERKIHAINGTDPDYTIRVVHSYDNPNRIRSSSQGNVQLLEQGRGQDPRVLVGYGLNAAWTEFDANGTVLCDVHWGAKTSWERGDIQSYRAYKFPWVGRPEYPPTVEITDDDAEVLVSWNGATDVVEWVLQCSEKETADEKAWTDLTRVPKRTFETTVPVPANTGDRYLRIIALAENGRRLDYGTSKTIDRGIMASYFPAVSHKLPPKVTHVTPLKMFLIVASSVSGLFVLYELYRRYLSWRGRPSAGPFRFRKEALYKLVSEV